jgi:hypothetical protein
MTYLKPISTIDATAALEHDAFMAAYSKAAGRAPYSHFDQHIIRTDEGCYWVADEGDYEAEMPNLIDRIVHTVRGGRSDEY